MKKIIKLENGNTKVVTINTKPSKTQQHHKESVDVNNIIKKYRNTGEITHVNNKRGAYMDLVHLPDYQTALNTVIKANDTFNEMPAHLRKRFGNDPKELIQFLSDKKNKDEAIALGLIEKPKKQDIIEKPKQTNDDQTKQPKQTNDEQTK